MRAPQLGTCLSAPAAVLSCRDAVMQRLPDRPRGPLLLLQAQLKGSSAAKLKKAVPQLRWAPQGEMCTGVGPASQLAPLLVLRLLPVGLFCLP